MLDVMAPENDFMLCLGRESTAEKLSAGYNISKGSVQEELKLIGLKYNLQSSRFMAQPQTVKSKIMCSVEKSPKPAQCNENGAIVFNFASSAKNALTLEGVKELTIHESLHDLGIAREGVVDNLINVCFGRPLDPLKARSESAKELGFTMGSGHIVPTSHTNSINVAEAEKAEIKIPRTLAETAIPNPPPAELNRPFTNAEAEVRNYAANPEGAAKAAYTQSLNSTSGIINFAKTAVASFTTPALAIPVQTRGLASVSAGSGRAYFAKSSGKNSDKYVIKEEILIGANNKD
ncbi:MAG: hypothetical protein EOP04_32715 [Proteobacteria bacterium]|nr:MAG: hypothetical protein EOP04_32715 [Pseudomonadota bacterium]